MTDPHHAQPVTQAGVPLTSARLAVILLHGRGADAADILAVGETIGGDDIAWLAPDAHGNAWYPYRFLEHASRNEPWLSSALALVERTVALAAQHVAPHRIVVGGFSQGACLALEYAARCAVANAIQRAAPDASPQTHPVEPVLGGVIAFAGGVIGADAEHRVTEGVLHNVPVFLGVGDEDAHIPVERVRSTASLFEGFGARVDCRVYRGLGHGIVRDEIRAARELLDSIPA
jgi:predicted esterase